MMTGWLQFFDSSSPSVRARISTAPPAGYGTNRCTAFVGNPVCAEAAPMVAITPAAVASIRTHPPMASLPIFLSLFFYLTSASRGYVAGRRGQAQHVDNPVDRVKFGDTPTRNLRRENWMATAAGQASLQ